MNRALHDVITYITPENYDAFISIPISFCSKWIYLLFGKEVSGVPLNEVVGLVVIHVQL